MEDILDRFDCNWFSSRLKRKVLSIHWEKLATAGLIGALMKAKLQLDSGVIQRVILKVMMSDATTADRMEVAQSLGCAREANFYLAMKGVPDDQMVLMQSCLPDIYSAECDWNTGEKAIIMEDLSDGITASLCFSVEPPINQGMEPSEQGRTKLFTDHLEIFRQSFFAIARFHALFWGADFHTMPWLKGYQWMQGKGRAEWECEINTLKSGKTPSRMISPSLAPPPREDDLGSCGLLSRILELRRGMLKCQGFYHYTIDSFIDSFSDTRPGY